ncbi:MAG: carboxypeptidase regulatory-like domain-containing protein [Candidatus Acidiferrum sp.]
MNLGRASLVLLTVLCIPVTGILGQEGGTISGEVKFTGVAPRDKRIDMSKEPECIRLHPDGLKTEDVVSGPGDTLANVVVYISAGPPDNSPVPETAENFDQKGCHYTTHVLALRVGQNVSISNSDPFNHNIHPLARINREWNRMQLPGTPPFTYSYENAEFIPVKCNIHAWMKAYFVVLRTSHFAVTGENGRFRLPDLPPGHYTITAWHETFGTQSHEINVEGGESQNVNFVFNAKP